jgi:diguanylate cyclase (GGDEF)-like protein
LGLLLGAICGIFLVRLRDLGHPMTVRDLLNLGTRARVSGALLLSGVIFYLDWVTADTFMAAALYVLVATLFYGLQRPWIFIGYGILGTTLNFAASVPDFDNEFFVNFAINRGLITVALLSTLLLLYRNNRSSEVLRRMATTDPLTGAFNRRHFMELMTREERRADRYRAVYSILMIDIDHFKRVNDTYGHQVGDRAIQAMAEACRKTTRPTDLVARYGGEEFVVALTHTDRAGAVRVAERLREAVAEITLQTEQGALMFSASIGVSTYVKTSTIEQLIGRADQALYRAKHEGRNRVCAEEPMAAAAAG